MGREVVAALVEGKLKSAITCYHCERPWYIAANCRARVLHDDETPTQGRGASMILALTEKRCASTKKRNRKKKGSRGKDVAAKMQATECEQWKTHAASCFRRSTDHEPRTSQRGMQATECDQWKTHTASCFRRATEHEPRMARVASCLQRPMPRVPTEETGSSTAD